MKWFGAISAANCRVVPTKAEFVTRRHSPTLAGVNPIPASSRNTVRHRLNRGGDRALNSALHMVAISRMTHDAETRQYVEKRRAEGRTDKEMRR